MNFDLVFSVGADVNAQAADLATPLMIASQEGHEACVDFLLDHSADPNIACSQDWPQLPIHAAAEFGHHRYVFTHRHTWLDTPTVPGTRLANQCLASMHHVAAGQSKQS